LESFWRFAQTELARLRLQEQLIGIVEMNAEDLPRSGPTDTSLLTIASRSQCLVVTDEGDLRGRCDRDQIEVRGSYEILAEWQNRVA
jgi:hypothetical protein